MYKRRCVDKQKDLGALTSARVPDKAAEVLGDNSHDLSEEGKIALLIQRYEKFLKDPEDSVSSFVGSWFGDDLVLNQLNKRILKKDHEYIKSATLADRKERYSALVRKEIKFVLQRIHSAILLHRDQGNAQVEIVFQSPWSDLYEALKKEHQEDGTTVQKGI